MKFSVLILIGLCVLAFFLQMIVPGFTEIMMLDQQYAYQWWRYLTAIFVHGGLAHLLLNMFALFLFGLVLESKLGTRRFLLVFFSAGIAANLISIFFYESALGASGAIFGIIGALVVLQPWLLVFAFGVPMPLIVAGVLWALADVFGVFMPSNVGNIAHLAGMVFGLIFGAIFRGVWAKQYRRNSIHIDEGRMRQWEERYLRRV